jgi:protein SCO1/2
VTRLAAALALAVLAGAAPAAGHEAAHLPALDYEPPAPGTYTLHRIMAAPGGEVVDLDGRARPLSQYTRDRFTLLAFVYTTCVDPDGCPLAYRVFDALRPSLAAAPTLRDRVRLVTLSFDPGTDTPAAMRRYAAGRERVRPGTPPWHFLTTRSTSALQPLLDGFGQDVRAAAGRPAGAGRREISHVLKVFLIDPAGDVREIYSSAFLHPRTVLNDIETLLAEP